MAESGFLKNRELTVNTVALKTSKGKVYNVDPRVVDHSGSFMNLIYDLNLEPENGVLTIPVSKIAISGDDPELEDINMKFLEAYVKTNPETYYRIGPDGGPVSMLDKESIKNKLNPVWKYTSRIYTYNAPGGPYGFSEGRRQELLDEQIERRSEFIPIVEENTNAPLDQFGEIYVDLPENVQKILDPLKQSPEQWAALVNLTEKLDMYSMYLDLFKLFHDVIRNSTGEQAVEQGWLPPKDEDPIPQDRVVFPGPMGETYKYVHVDPWP